MKQLYGARGFRQVKQPVPTAVNEGNHMEKMRTVLIGMVLAAAQVASAPVRADAINTFRNQQTNRCIDDTDRGGLRTFACNNTHAQQWNVRQWADDTRELRNMMTSRCIDDTDSGGFRTWACNGTPAQSWFIRRWDDGTIRFQNQLTGRCMDDTDPGGFRTFPCNSTPAQSWF